jgi:arylsulfatase A-like enzyme
VDDATASATGWPLTPVLAARLAKEGLPLEPPTRTNGFNTTSQYSNGYSGDRTKPGTLAANVIQQQWFADVTTRAILPAFSEDPSTPFAILFWSRDPDGSQHNQGDSRGSLAPGINGVTSKAGLRNADKNLQQILSWLDAHPAIKANTDVFVTSDHGFATISRREIDVTGRPTTSEAARHDYLDAAGRVDSAAGTLPPGFLAIDLARSLGLNLFDPDQHPDGSRLYRQLHIDPDAKTWEHPTSGNGLLGIDVTRPDASDARVIVAANGGADLIYVPDRDADRVRRVVATLLTYDYVGSVFVDEGFGDIPGALPERLINFVGASPLPRPTIVVAFKVFYLDPDNLQTAIQISDTVLQEGQGMHGGFGRDSTFNNMAAIGPDFKRGYADPAPVSNADIAPTLARVMGLELAPGGPLRGRILTEALDGQASAAPVAVQTARSSEANGRQTFLLFQEFAGLRYPDVACLVSAKDRDPGNCRR